MNKTITVIIVNYYSSIDLSICVSSLKKNKCFPMLSIHVVDNSCNREEQSKLELLFRDKSISLHFPKKNLGFAKACNFVYQKTDSKLIFLINPDAFLFEQALDRLISEIQPNNLIAAVGPKIFWDDDALFLLPRSFIFSPLYYFLAQYTSKTMGYLLWLYSLFFRKRSILFWKTESNLLQKNLSGGSVLLRRTLVDKAGGLFDNKFFMYFEDSDLFFRLVKQGYSLKYVPSAKIVHKFSGCARNEQDLKNQYMNTSHKYFLSKHFSHNLLILLAKKFKQSQNNVRWSPQTVFLGEIDLCHKLKIILPETANYLVEWSPSNFFLPAAGQFIQADLFVFSQNVWDIMPEGDNYLRIAPTNKFWIKPIIWHWIKKH